MNIGGMQKISMVDYPGHLCCTVFLSGCNLRCSFCHNPSLVGCCDKSAEIPTDEVIEFLEKRKGLLDAVCITGGEPTLNPKLERFIETIRNMGYKVKLDTNGTQPGVIKRLLDKAMIDYIAVDIKATDEKYSAITGCNVRIEDINETIELVMNSGVDYEFRTTFMPDLDARDIQEIAQKIAGSKKYVVQQFRNSTTLDSECSKKEPHDTEYINSVVRNVSPLFQCCEARGI